MSKSAKSQSQDVSGENLDYYQVQEILKKRETPSGVEYLIKWKGYPDPKDFTWQPIQHLKQVMHLINEFNQRKEVEVAKKKMKKQIQQQKPKKVKKLEDQVVRETVSENEAEEISSDYNDQRGNKKKGRQRKGGFLPKIVKVNGEQQRQPIKKRLHTSLQHSSKKPVKDQISKYMIPVNPKTEEIKNTSFKSQAKQGEKSFWFNSDPYKIGSIFKHFVTQGNLNYLCNIVNKNGDLACVTKIAQKQFEAIDAAMQKQYILNVLHDIWKSKQRQATTEQSQFEKSWKDL